MISNHGPHYCEADVLPPRRLSQSMDISTYAVGLDFGQMFKTLSCSHGILCLVRLAYCGQLPGSWPRSPTRLSIF